MVVGGKPVVVGVCPMAIGHLMRVQEEATRALQDTQDSLAKATAEHGASIRDLMHVHQEAARASMEEQELGVLTKGLQDDTHSWAAWCLHGQQQQHQQQIGHLQLQLQLQQP